VVQFKQILNYNSSKRTVEMADDLSQAKWVDSEERRETDRPGKLGQG
jgi:hypothetical protein